MYFKTVILLVDIRYISLPNDIKKIKSTPQKFFMKNVVFWQLYHLSKNAGTVLRNTYIQIIFKKKNENQAFCLGVESRIVKKFFSPKR